MSEKILAEYKHPGGRPRRTPFTVRHFIEKMTEEDRADRERCKKDLFFLCRDVLGYDLLTEKTHKQYCEFFVKKDDTKTIIEQDSVKRRLFLAPRGSFKTTIDLADCIQWIINFPDIRIVVITAASDLAVAFVDNVQSHFLWNKLNIPTRFQRLFPEFCIDPKAKGKTGEFTVPNREKAWVEPTIWGIGADTNQSGWHAEVGKCDDTVSNRNATNVERCQTVTKNLHVNRKMIRPGGYWDLLGTRYNTYEAYADAIENGDKGLRVLCLRAMWLKSDPEHHVVPDDLRNYPEEAWELLFPEELTYKFLMKEFKDDEVSFFSQYMNDPIVAGNVSISIDDMRRATIPLEQVPALGEIHVTWDLAYSTKKGRDFSSGVVGRHYQGRIVVVDAERGRFTTKELAHKIVHLSLKWGVNSSAVENSAGAKFIEPEIERIAQAMMSEFYVEWIDVENSKDAKAKRFEALQPLLVDGRLQFAANCPFLDVLYKEFCNFNHMTHQDLADACSRQMRYVSYTMMDLVQQKQETEKLWQEFRDKDRSDYIYRRGKYAEEPVKLIRNPFGLDDILGGLNG